MNTPAWQRTNEHDLDSLFDRRTPYPVVGSRSRAADCYRASETVGRFPATWLIRKPSVAIAGTPALMNDLVWINLDRVGTSSSTVRLADGEG